MKTTRRKFHLPGPIPEKNQPAKTLCGMVIQDPTRKARLFLWDPARKSRVPCSRCRAAFEKHTTVPLEALCP